MTLNTTDEIKLRLTARKFLFEQLDKYGNDITKEQKESLSELLSYYTSLSVGNINGKYAFPLPTGLGKTQSIIAWIRALHELGIDEVSIAVCQSKVEELCRLKRSLIEEWSVPENKIGLVHSYDYNEDFEKDVLETKVISSPPGKKYASMRSNDDYQTRQIVLLTHNKIKMNEDIWPFCYYKDEVRDVVIWDESMLVTENIFADFKVVNDTFNRIYNYRNTNPRLKNYVDYFSGLLDKIKKEIKRVSYRGLQSEPIDIPKLSKDERRQYRSILENFGENIRDRNFNQRLQPIIDIMEASGNKIRPIKTTQGTALCSYELLVPDELKNVIILDASHRIRKLVNYDKSIQSPGWLQHDKLVSYENVTINHLHYPSGRYSFENHQKEMSIENRLYSLEISNAINNYVPRDEAILIFTFKGQGSDSDEHINILKNDLQRLGHDVEQHINFNGVKKKRFNFLTWGQETSISEFSFCSNVFFAGVIHRSDMDLASSILAQKRDYEAEIDTGLIKKVLESEITHCVYQAICRGACRKLEGGKTKPMQVYLIHKDRTLENKLRRVMPRVRWKKWTSQFLLKNKTKLEQTIDDIQDYLTHLPDDVDNVSTKQMKKELEGKGNVYHPRTFSEATKLYDLNEVDRISGDWVKKGRTFHRLSGELLGFKDETLSNVNEQEQ